MEARLEDFKTGWFGLSIGLTDDEIGLLVRRLQELQASRGHFHARGDFTGPGGVADIEFSWQEHSQTGGLSIE